MMFRTYCASALLAVVSCSSANTASRFVPDDGFAADPLNYTEVSRTLVDDRNYLVSYGQDSGRLGIVDADSFQEIWGTYTDRNVPFVFNLPGHEGAGLLSTGLFTVVIAEGSRSFTIPVIKGNAWNRASDVIALVAFDAVEKKVHAIKYRGAANWEQITLDAFPDGAGFSESGAVAVSAAGTLALVVAPVFGSYVVIADDGEKYTLRRSCVFDSSAPAASVSSAAIDEASQSAFFAVGGKIYKIDLAESGTCGEPTTWTEVYTGEDNISRIGFLSTGKLYALLADAGSILFFDLENNVLTKSSESATSCTDPVSANKFGDFVAVTCANRVTSSSDGSKGRIRNVSLKFLGTTGVVALTQKIDFEKKSGIVFNPGKAEFLQVYNSAAGEIDVHSVPTGAVRHVEGIFMDGILNKL